MGLRGFNLLKKQADPPTAWEKIYTWVLGTARIIIIIVEFIVVISFGTRIIVDTQAKQLDKKIEDKQRSLSAFSTQEADYRKTQMKMSNYKAIWQNSSNYSELLREIDNYLNSNFSNLSINITDQVVTIRAEGDVDKISDFENAMKSSDYFINVETFELNRDSSGDRRANFGLRAVIVEISRLGLEAEGI